MFTHLRTQCASLLETLLDLIFPPSERGRRVRVLTTNHLSLLPQVHTVRNTSITTLLPYNEAPVKDTIQTLKYERSKKATHLLASALADYLLESLAEGSLFTSPQKTILIPVPLARKRQHERGYNQVTEVLALLPSYGVSTIVRTDIIGRIRETPHQTRLPRAERLTNLINCFALANASLTGALKGYHIVLIDDVTTTGSTLLEAKSVLEKTGATITLLAFARA